MNVDVVLNLIMTAVMFLVFLGTLWLLRTEKREARTVLFAFAVACMLLSGLYWLSYGVLRPGTRMPFAANEIAESAMFLLFGAALKIGTMQTIKRIFSLRHCLLLPTLRCG